ncbi:MAG: L-lactate dehydrogenase [Armatimonadetes bacterium]|nr:L-lactate dehydrogenase [Armatimonadota bacterium]
MKVSIIGGGGRVGSNAAYALQLGGIVKEIAIVDVAEDLAQGEALDLRHGASVAGSQKIYAGGYEAVAGSDIMVITAGLRRKPDESRLELINRNVVLFKGILDEVKKVKLPDGAIVLVVSNPVDILTYLAVKSLNLPPSRVIGLGTALDTVRFRSLLAEYFEVDPTDVDALILGEHGDSMVPIWSSATINGVPLRGFPNYDETEVKGIADFTKKSGAEVIRLKGGAGYAVGLAIKQVVDAIALDKKAILPVSSLMQGYMGIDDVCFSVPTVVGRSGAEKLIVIALSDEEKSALIRSADTLRETLTKIG